MPWLPSVVEYAHADTRRCVAGLAMVGVLEVEGKPVAVVFRLAFRVAHDAPVVAADAEDA